MPTNGIPPIDIPPGTDPLERLRLIQAENQRLLEELGMRIEVETIQKRLRHTRERNP